MKLDLRPLVLALPAAYLLLSADRLAPDRERPPITPHMTWDAAAPTLPPLDEGRFGRPGDPLNLVFVATPAAVRAALTEAGWTEVPTSVRGSLAAGIAELLDGRPLAAFPPMNDYRLIGRRQAMNWAIPVRPFEERHHFRLWFTGLVDPAGRPYWWGSGNYDRSIRWSDLSHRPDPDMDRERDFIVASLSRSKFLESAALVPLPQIPPRGANDKGYAYFTDGRAAVIVLKRLIRSRRP
ncbi:MAG: LssY C-terminal domain-containing protein [Elusimicrobiota bacterium]